MKLPTGKDISEMSEHQFGVFAISQGKHAMDKDGTAIFYIKFMGKDGTERVQILYGYVPPVDPDHARDLAGATAEKFFDKWGVGASKTKLAWPELWEEYHPDGD